MSERLMIGAHLSTSKGLPAMLNNAVEIGATCAQIFTASPRMWRGKKYTAAEAKAFQDAQQETGVRPIVSHDSYLINLAAANADILAKSLNGFREEIIRCGTIGLPMVVMHPGGSMGSTAEEGLARLAESLNELIPLADEQGVQIVLETTAGQGTSLGGNLAQFPQLFEMIPAHKRLGICVDLCHVFVSGYDLRGAENYQRFWQEFDQHIGFHRLKVIHLNDTTSKIGSHLDRHANIGTGQLGLETFQLLMKDPRLVNIPKILETPGGLEKHVEGLRILRELAG